VVEGRDEQSNGRGEQSNAWRTVEGRKPKIHKSGVAVKKQKTTSRKPVPAPTLTAAAPFRKSTAREYFESIVIAVILALFIRTFVVQAFKIPTGSMENNLLIGDHLLVNKFVFGPSLSPVERALLPERLIRRGDVLVFKYPQDRERDFIKRVIGLPGETLEVKNKRVYINGKMLDEPYVHFIEPPQSPSAYAEITSYDLRERYGPIAIPAGKYFMMGDNRDNSEDSRYWGLLSQEDVKGQALMIYWSYESTTEDYEQTGIIATVKDLFTVVTQFFTRTRWSRMFHVVG
jgi:signal peptidase I